MVDLSIGFMCTTGKVLNMSCSVRLFSIEDLTFVDAQLEIVGLVIKSMKIKLLLPMAVGHLVMITSLMTKLDVKITSTKVALKIWSLECIVNLNVSNLYEMTKLLFPLMLDFT